MLAGSAALALLLLLGLLAGAGAVVLSRSRNWRDVTGGAVAHGRPSGLDRRSPTGAMAASKTATTSSA